MAKKLALHLLNTLKHGGGENVALNYAHVLRKLNVESFFIGKIHSTEFVTMISDFGEIRERISWKDVKEADYIFIHSNKNLIRTLFLRLLPLKWKKKQIFYIQHLFFSEKKFRLLAFLINSVCTDFIQITPITKHFIKKYIKISTHFLVNFYNNRYPSEEYHKIRQEVREKLNISSEKQIVMFSAVFKPGKRLEDFLKMAEYFSGDSRYFFLLAGDGPQADLAKKYSANNLIWLGFINDVERYLIASDIYFFPSVFKQEMLPMALVEAINTGKKILAYSTDINNFLLNHCTAKDVDSAIELLRNDQVPVPTERYDGNYAYYHLKKILRSN